MLRDKLETLGPPILVREQAFEQVRNAIISGRLAPGTRLIERELCQAMGISRASVRETIRRLEAERLIQVEPRRGPTVMTLTAQQAREIYEIRGMLEALLIRRFTEMATDGDIDALFGLFEEIRKVAARDAAEEIVPLMLRFNEHLLSVVQHDIARDLLGQLNARINWLRLKAMAKPGRLAESIHEVGAVLDAVRARDPDLAAQRMGQLVQNAAAAAIEQLVEHPTGH